jgi:urease subunit alpha
MFGSFGAALRETCVTFMSRAAVDAGVAQRLELRRRVMPVFGTRTLSKRSMVRNDCTPDIDVNPETYAVIVDGVHATVPPARSISLNQLYFFS